MTLWVLNGILGVVVPGSGRWQDTGVRRALRPAAEPGRDLLQHDPAVRQG